MSDHISFILHKAERQLETLKDNGLLCALIFVVLVLAAYEYKGNTFHSARP